MNLETLTDQQLKNLRDTLQRDLQRLRSTKKNLNNTIRNITNEMQQYYTREGADVVINGGEAPHA